MNIISIHFLVVEILGVEFMLKKKCTMKKRDLCFYTFWFVVMIGKGLGFDSSDSQFYYMLLAVAPFALFKIFLSRWTSQELILGVFLGLIGFAVWVCSGGTDILLIIVVVIACKGMNTYKLLKLTFWVRAVLYVSRTSLAILGLADMQQVTNTRGVWDIRYALGYVHPNMAHYELFMLTALLVLIWHKQMKKYHYLLVCGYNVFIYQYTHSRTGLLMTFFVLILTFIADRRSGHLLRLFIKKFGEYAYVIGAVTSVILCQLQGEIKILRSLGTFWSRFYTGKQIMIQVPLSLFGKRYVSTDLGTIFILYGRGVIVFVLFLVSMTLLLRKFRKNEMYIEEIVGIAYAIYFMMERSMVSILLNIIFLFFTWIIYPDSQMVSLKCSSDETVSPSRLLNG